MLVLAPTTNIDLTSTQIKHEVFFEYNISSTRLGNKAYNLNSKDLNLLNWKRDNVISTHLNDVDEQSSSTWEEQSLSNFDLVANIVFSKSIKVKSRIKSVTKYQPYIVID